MGTVNYSTTIAASKTIAEMQSALAKAGARQVAVEYDNGSAAGLAFSLRTAHGDRVFTLPVDIGAMQRSLTKQFRNRQLSGMGRAKAESIEQAERVAWRVCKDWLLAQLALIEAEMATLDQVMLPYLRVDGERTLYQAYREREEVALLEASLVDR